MSSSLAHLDALLAVLLDSMLGHGNLHHLPDILQHHLVSADGLGSEDAKSLMRVDVSTNRRQRLAGVTAVDKRGQMTSVRLEARLILSCT